MKRIILTLILILLAVMPADARYQDWWQIASAAADVGGATFTVPLKASGSMKVDNYTVYHTGNFPGTTASDSDQVDGYHASTSAAINTVVVRSSTGNIITTTASTTGNATVGGTLGVTGKATTGTLESGAATFTGGIYGPTGSVGQRKDSPLTTGDWVLGTPANWYLGANSFWNGSAMAKMSSASASALIQLAGNSKAAFLYTSDSGNSDPYQNGPYTVWHGGMTSFKSNGSTAFCNSTSDGSDNQYMLIGAGGSAGDVSRGAYIKAFGNEHTSAGDLDLVAGNVAAGGINFYTGGSHIARFYNGGALYLFTFSGGGTTGASINNDGQLIRTPSDVRLKEDVVTITAGLDKVRTLRGVTFNWKDKKAFGSRRDYGMIAQEVEAVIPEVVTQNYDGMKSLDYQKIVPVLVEAIKDQQRIIEDLKSRIETLEAK